MHHADQLASYIEQHRAKPFAWGRHDCVTFADGWAACITGASAITKGLKWSSALSAKKAILKVGGLAGVISQTFKSVDPAYACDGDVVLMAGDITGAALGIVVGPHILALSEEGLITLSRDAASHAWRVSQ